MVEYEANGEILNLIVLISPVIIFEVLIGNDWNGLLLSPNFTLCPQKMGGIDVN